MTPRLWIGLAGIAALSGCGTGGRQSVLDPTGTDALAIASLWWGMLGAAVVLWLLVAGIFVYVTRIRPTEMKRSTAEALIVGGGVVFPVVALAGLIVYALPLMTPVREADADLTVHVTGEQWWWRVVYDPEGEAIVSANELRLPVGRRVTLLLDADKVIHSFWVPALGGKTDMIPGRQNRMTVEAVEPGTYRGQCAEFCGASHALMAFEVVVMPEDAFIDWARAEAQPAMAPEGTQAQAGLAVFNREGCGACHAVRGTAAIGQVGPDLTHVGTRLSIGAGILPNDRAALMRWIAHTGAVKPEVEMPDYDYLPEGDLAALAAYLGGLK